MNLFNLVAKLTLDSSEYDRAVMAAKGKTAQAGGGMVKAIGNARKAIKTSAIAMGAALTAFGVSSVKTGMEFDTAMSQVSATLGLTNEQMQESVGEVDLAWGHFSGNLRDYAKEMGEHTKFSAIESAEALNYMALAGYDTQKSMEMLPPVLNLAAAGSMELATASDMVTDASSALGLSQEQTVKMVDQMARTASKTNTSVEQLGRGILTVGGTAKVMKGGTTELAAALGILADNGTKGAQGGTALRNVLMTISGKKFEKTFGAMGVEAFDAQGKMRSLKDILADMNEQMEGMSDEEKTKLIQKTFNARDLKNVNALLATTEDRWDSLTDAIENSEGAAQDMADTQLDNLEGDITLLKSAFEGLQIEVSDKLSPAFRKVIQFITKCIGHASTLGPIILGLATALGVFAVALKVQELGGFIGMITKATKAFKAFGLVLLGNPIGLVIALIAGLVVAITLLWRNNEDFRNKVTAIWDSIKSKIGVAIKGIKTAFGTFKSMVASARQTFNNVKNAIINPIKTAYTTVKGWIDKIKKFFPLKIGKIFSNLKIPHIKVSGGKAPFGIGGLGTAPKISVSWYKKAEEVPYLFSNATLFGAGERKDEVLYGKKALMDDIREATSGNKGDEFIINLNYDASTEASEMLRDLARGVKRYRMAGAI